MHSLRLVQSVLVLLVLLNSARGDSFPSRDPLTLIPDKVDLCVKLEQPDVLIQFIQHSPLFRQFQIIEPVREFYDSTNFRRFTQLIAYFEKELGMDYAAIVDRLAGR